MHRAERNSRSSRNRTRSLAALLAEQDASLEQDAASDHDGASSDVEDTDDKEEEDAAEDSSDQSGSDSEQRRGRRPPAGRTVCVPAAPSLPPRHPAPFCVVSIHRQLSYILKR